MASNVNMNDLGNDNCVVCFREIDIFSIGECNHPVCHECSARMRVLCLQNECPICRQDLPKVIFTRNVLPYVTLDKQFRSGLYDKKFRICFEDLDIQKRFYRLLDNTCSVCDIRPFLEFDHLKDHVRKVHELFYCDICTDNLKIFSSERRCYSRPDLATHRRRGDPDNTSHKGHPLCEYCELRFLDKDELFRHLRREHYYCHFCDADGINLFYANYGDMREHFKGEHYLCEEADCADEKFTAVFRTDIDLKAHRSSVHSHSMTKFEARQARTLELEFSFGPRGRGGGPATSEIQRGGGRGGNRNNNQRDTQREFDRFNENCYPTIQPTPQIDSKNEQQFPSLGGKPGSSVQLASSVRHITYGQAGLQRTKENYPALGNQQPNPLQPSTSKSSKKPTASMLLKNTGGLAVVLGPNRSAAAPATKKVFNAAAEFPALSTNTLKKSPTVTVAYVKPRDDFFPGGSVHGLSRPSTAPTPKKAANPSSDFPSLSSNASKKKQNNLKALVMEDLPAPTKNVHANLMSAKHRALVTDEYVSLASKMSSKVQTIQQVDVILPKSEFKASVPKLNSANNFPSLGLSGGLDEPPPQWITLKSSNGRPTQSQNDSPRKGKKVNEMPDLSMDFNKNGNKSNDKAAKKDDKVKAGSNDFKPKSTGDDSSNNNKENKSKNVLKDISKQSGYDFPKATPPPGFSSNQQSTQQLKKPPGFHNFSPDPANDIVPVSKGSYTYMPPGNATKRNTALVGEFQKALNTHESMSQFREMSQMFRDGQYFAKAYYESCRIVLGENFNEIFPELLALLPDIDKQQSLYVAHTHSKEQTEQKTKKKSNKLKQLEVCATCKQVLLTPDLMSHLQLHKLENSFPSLSNGTGGGSSSSSSSNIRPSHWKK
ncbi:unnamed protein product [Diamesa hyperborea]